MIQCKGFQTVDSAARKTSAHLSTGFSKKKGENSVVVSTDTKATTDAEISIY
jgi:hypothetical protein